MEVKKPQLKKLLTGWARVDDCRCEQCKELTRKHRHK
jgi:hypothetical protein